MTDASSLPQLRLYTTHTSSASHRLWIALAYKQLPYEVVYVNLSAKEQHKSDYLSRINPNARVPALEVVQEGGQSLWLRNSLTALLYLDSAFLESPRLLPPETDWPRRALVLDLVGIIQADTQPVCNSSVARRAAEWAVGKTLEEGADHEAVIQKATEWRVHAIERALMAVERTISSNEVQKAGKYAVGDDFTMADVILAAQLDMALA